ncbi:MAG: hypothetical protein HKN44_03155 [Ilumatobacter sp.]|nr:hypothetical protein [Ilumatobacter sp.]
MFTTGSKLLIGSSVLATLAAIVYGVTQVDSLGIVGLTSAAIALAFLAGVNVWARDSNVSSMDSTAVATAEAADAPPGASIWPMVFAVGAATALLGLVTQQSIFTIGLVVAFSAGAQWMIQAWAEAASPDAAVATHVRSRLANPLEYPLLGAVAVGAIAFSFSRVMLWLSKTNTVIAFVVLAAVVAGIAFYFAFRPSVTSGAIGGALAVFAIAVVAGGVAAGVDGQRDIHVHETTADLALEGHCDSPDEFEPDEKASQTVAAKSSLAAEVILTESGELEFDVPGPIESGGLGLTLPRANPNNILFRNESGEHRRLTVDLGPLSEDEIAELEEAAAEDSHGEEAHVSERRQICTTLIEEGSVQLLTLIIAEPSLPYDDDPEAYRFFVPGTDAELNLVVP